MSLKEGRVTIPTNLDVVPETIELMKRWGADAIRDCDGTQFPEDLVKTGAKIYATYYTTRKDNEWAKANPDEVQQCYVMTAFYTAVKPDLEIPLMKGISKDLMMVNTGVETLLIELGYISIDEDLKNIISNQKGYVKGIVDAVETQVENQKTS